MKNCFNFKTLELAVFFAFSCLSCQKESVSNDTSVQKAPTIFATVDDGRITKTSISTDVEGRGTIFWLPKDEINVFFGNSSAKYISQNSSPSESATFETTDIIGISEGASNNIWGLYPYNSEAQCDGSSVTTNIPAKQYGVNGSFDDDLFPTIAQSTSTTLHFFNICGGIKFTLSRDDITAITFRGNNNENIAGDIRVCFENGEPVASITNGINEITLTPKTGTTFEKGSIYYMIMLPTVLSNGFTMKFSTTEELGTLKYDSESVSIKRSIFGKKTDIDSYATFVKSQPNNVITYTTTDGQAVGVYSKNFKESLVSNVYENGVGTLTFDSSVSTIPKQAFYSGSNLKTISIPQGVTNIETDAFYNQPYLTSFSGKFASNDGRCIIIDETIIAFAPYGIREYHTPDGVKSIGKYAFRETWIENNKTVTNRRLYLSEGITTIGNDPFYGNWEYVGLPSTLEITEANSFRGLGGVSVTIPSKVKTLDEAVFNKRIVEITNSIPATLVGSNTNKQYQKEYLILVPQGTLASYRTAWADYVDRLAEKKSEQPLNEIWYTTTDGKPAVSNRSNPNIKPSWEQGIVSNSGGKMVFDAPLTKIPYDAFENSNLVSVSLPDGLYYIGNNSFQLSVNLKDIHLGEYLKEISYYAFGECPKIESIIIPDNVEYLDNCFANCTALSSVKLPLNLKVLGSKSSSNYLGTNVFAGCTALKEIELPTSLEEIGIGCFSSSGITNIKIPSSVTSIGSSAFKNCDNLSSIEFPDNITSIGDEAVAYCDKLKAVRLPNGISTLNSIFIDCISLESITIPSGVKSIGSHAFEGCSSLTNIYAYPNPCPSFDDLYFNVDRLPNTGTFHCPSLSSYSKWQSFFGSKKNVKDWIFVEDL